MNISAINNEQKRRLNF